MNEETQPKAPTVIASQVPLQEPGVTQAPELSFDAPPIKPIEATHTLQDISKDYVLFTHAPLIVHAGMNPDPLKAFQNEHKLQAPITMLRMPVKVFHGLAVRDHNGVVIDTTFENHLFAISKQDFPALYRFLGTIAAVDRAAKMVICSLTQIIPILDVVAICNKSALPKRNPMVSVFTIGLNTNHGQVFFEPPKVPAIMNPVKVRISRQPDPKMVMMGQAVLAEEPQPLAPSDVPADKISVIGDPTELIKSGEALEPVGG